MHGRHKEGAKGEGMKQVKIQVAPYSSLLIWLFSGI